MGKIYDNWERLVSAVLVTEHLRELSLLSSPSSNSSQSSTFQSLDQSPMKRQGSELLANHSDIMIDHSEQKKIDKEELGVLLYQIGGIEPLDEEELQQFLSQVDKDGDGCITIEELLEFGSANFSPPTCHTEMREEFDFFDLDGDGKITAEELFRVFKIIGQPETLEPCLCMIREFDRNGDGFICFQDFSLVMG